MSRLYLFLFMVFGILNLSPLEAKEPPLFSLADSASKGDYIVYKIGKTYTLLRFGPVTDESLHIEEISIPVPLWERFKHLGWKGWVEKEAPAHSSWIVYAFSPNEKTTKAYSRSRDVHFEIPREQNIFLTLLDLTFKEIPYEKRRRLGPIPTHSGKDPRPIWNPPLRIEGRLFDAPFTAYKATWPQDESELSGKQIELYLPSKKESLSPFPSYLPFWVQTGGGAVQPQIQAVDSGSGMVAHIEFFSPSP